ncbi:MobA/MobL family protein [Loktanella atrilutea]|uniref:MobA/MobL family protein n=1 Tax=Loktanella atrilutea TaxID=366533 RepID=A0A1M5F1P9_LOKAT|nr:MobQ family relaxase [Loktanella atrilutea]SHF85367.1 MobA/MobL family protein [Loktanella atrilutea]
MASYHLSVKTVKRSAGRSATAAAAYRAGESIACEREGRVHDYTAKSGVLETFILAPEGAPNWAQDRAALWNAAEARETRKNSVTAREWEVSLPSEISDADRVEITRDFAQALVDRYGIAVDVAIHAPHREGDQRNHHAHILTSTRRLEPEGFTDKTRVLDAAKTGGVEIEEMRGVWAGLQNAALERAAVLERVDHRSLETQREAALERGDALEAEALDRDPELKLGPAANAIERREMRAAEREGRTYEPVTERGAVVYAARQARTVYNDMRARVLAARETYALERDAGRDRVSSGLAALRAAAGRQGLGDGHSLVEGAEKTAEPLARGSIRERLAGIVARDVGATELKADVEDTRQRLVSALGRAVPVKGTEIELEDGDERDGKEKVRQREGRSLGDDTGWSI